MAESTWSGEKSNDSDLWSEKIAIMTLASDARPLVMGPDTWKERKKICCVVSKRAFLSTGFELLSVSRWAQALNLPLIQDLDFKPSKSIFKFLKRHIVPREAGMLFSYRIVRSTFFWKKSYSFKQLQKKGICAVIVKFNLNMTKSTRNFELWRGTNQYNLEFAQYHSFCCLFVYFQVGKDFWAAATIEKVVWKHCNQFRSQTVVVQLKYWRCGSL